MKYVELNRTGNFEHWDQNKLVELLCLKGGKTSGEDYLIYQNEHIKLHIFIMEPNERIPFQEFNNDFNLVCMTGGAVLCRHSHGGISLAVFDKGECIEQKAHNTNMISDFQNVGEGLLVLAIVENKRTKQVADVTFRIAAMGQSLFSKN